MSISKLVIIVLTGPNKSVRIDGGTKRWIDSINTRPYHFTTEERKELMKVGFPDPMKELYGNKNEEGRSVWFYGSNIGIKN